MLNDILVLSTAISLWLGLGYPVAKSLGPCVISRPLAAPPLGLAIQAVITTILYVSGVELRTAFAVSFGLALPGFAMAIRDLFAFGLTRSTRIVSFALLFTILFVLLPQWVAPAGFSVFQGNVGDEFSYVSRAFLAQHYDFATLQQTDPTAEAFIIPVAAGWNWLTRSSIPFVFGSLSSTLQLPVLAASYAYLGTTQTVILFAAIFTLANLFKLSDFLTAWAGIGLTIGFFTQYVFDINAWSHLTSIPLLIIYVGLLIGPYSSNYSTGASSPCYSMVGFFCSMLICFAGLLYIYPEILPLLMVISTPILLWQFFYSVDRRFMYRRLMLLGLAALSGIALCTFAWQITFGHLISQVNFAVGSEYYAQEWWKFFQAYLFGYDNNPDMTFNFSALLSQSPGRALYNVLSVVMSFFLGIFGLFYLQFDSTVSLLSLIVVGLLASLTSLCAFWLGGLFWNRPDRSKVMFVTGALCGGFLSCSLAALVLFLVSDKEAIPIIPIHASVRFLWKLILCSLLGWIIAHCAGSLVSDSKSLWRVDRVLWSSVLCGLGFVASFIFLGRFWAAGKGLVMLSPLLVLSFVGCGLVAGLDRTAIKLGMLIYIGTQISFGIYRSYAATQNPFGVYYSAPYPAAAFQKLAYRWDYYALRRALTGCSHVEVDLEGFFHSMFVKMALIDAGVDWSAPRPVAQTSRQEAESPILKQIKKPDCVATTEARAIQPWHSIIWLRWDDRIMRFFNGETNRFDAVPNVPYGLETDGLAADESRIVGVAWTNGHAIVRVPNNPAKPVRRLTVTVSPERLPPEIQLRVLINGRLVLDELVSRSSDWQDWTRTVNLPDFGNETVLNIEVVSDTFVYPGDTRVLGARLRFLSLER
jgi:hypothetical protein